MPARYKVAKGDFLVESKHADATYRVDDDFTMFFYNTPKKGKALVVEYIPYDYPALCIYVTANWKARRDEKRVAKEPHNLKTNI